MFTKEKSRGFVLIEAMISAVVLALGILAIGKLNAYMMNATGIAKARAEAIQIAQSKAEELRNVIERQQYIDLNVGPFSEEISGVNADFTLGWSVDSDTQPYDLNVTVAWSTATGEPESYTLGTSLAWTDPGRSFTPLSPPSISLPSGLARKPGPLDTPTRDTTGLTENPDGTYIYERGDGTKELLDATGKVLLVLPTTVDDPDPEFAVIRGKVFSDDTANGFSMDLSCTTIILSSTGECVRTTPVADTSGGMSMYDYACYVGKGWYGNVGVEIGTFENCPATNPSTLPNAKICVGDPAFPTNLSTTSPYAIEGHRRVYRGFRATGDTFALTGVADGSSYPPDGKPKPADLDGPYSSIPDDSAENAFNHHFFLTKSNLSCHERMNISDDLNTQDSNPARNVNFARNAGGNFCISPDDHAAADICPDTWPGWPGFAGGSGTDDGGDGTIPANCVQAIAGGMKDKQGIVEITGASVANCTYAGGNSVNYNCTVTGQAGSTVSVRNYREQGQTYLYDETKEVSFSCTTPMSVSFDPI